MQRVAGRDDMRFLGQLFALFAILVLGLAAWLGFAGQDLAQPAGRLWFALDSASLNLLQAVVQRYIHAGLWDSVFVPYLLLPAWGAMAVLFLIFFLLSGLFQELARRRRSFRR